MGSFTTAPDISPEDDSRHDVIVQGELAKRSEEPKQVAPLIDTPRSVVVLPAEVIAQTGSNSL